MTKLKKSVFKAPKCVCFASALALSLGAINSAHGQSVENNLLTDELNQVSKDLGAEIIYDAEQLKDSKVGSVDADELDVHEYLKRIVEPAGFKVGYQGEKILVLTPDDYTAALQRGDISALAPDDFSVEESETLELEEMLVTGSRIRRDGLGAIDSVRVIDSSIKKARGDINITESLFKSSSTVSAGNINATSSTSFAQSSGAGEREIDLRGLGAERTLVLVNGRSVPPGGVGVSSVTTNLATLPSAAIESIEILSQGTSSVYGSESLAGTVNYVTLNEFDGFQLELSGIFTEDGGGEQSAASIAYGSSGDLGSLLVAYEYNRQESLKWGDRDRFRCELDVRIDPVTGQRTDIDPVSGMPRCQEQEYGFASYNDLDTFDQVVIAPRPGGFHNGVSGFTELETVFDDQSPQGRLEGALSDVSATRPNVDLLGENETHNLFFMADRQTDLWGGTRFYTEVGYANNSNVTVNQVNALDFDLDIDSPLNPFSFENSLFNPDIDPTDLTVTTRANIAEPISITDIDSGRIVLGADGVLPIEGWRWSFDLQYGRTEAELRTEVISRSRVSQALDAVFDGNEQLVCRDSSNGCRVLNPLDPTILTGSGQIDPALRNFLVKPGVEETTTERSEATFVVDGNLFEMPYGTAAIAFGLNYREDSVEHDQSLVLSQADQFFSLSGVETIDPSEFDTLGIFAEIELPLLADKAWADDVVVNLSGRHTEDDSFSNFSYKASGRYSVNDIVSFRASYSTSFRSPNLFERFRNDNSSDNDFVFSGFIDPCDGYGFELNPNSVGFQNCQAAGLPLDYLAEGPISVLQGANPDLEPETGESVILGIDFNVPSLEADFSITYFDVSIDDSIISQSAFEILDSCYNSVALSSALCGPEFFGGRDQNGRIISVDARDRNSARDSVEGIDFDASWAGVYGEVSFFAQAEATYLLSRDSQRIVGDQVFDLAGSIGFPEWKGDLALYANYKKLGLSWNINYTSSVDQAILDPVFYATEEGRSLISSVSSYAYHNFNLSYSINDNATISVGVNNVFDERAPFISDLPVSANVGTFASAGQDIFNYDVLGRSVVMRLGASF